MNCPLCQNHKKEAFLQINLKQYFLCDVCCLIFLDKRFYLSPQDEKARYQTHDNNPEDVGYQQFLQPALEALNSRLKPKSKGLDFGCGEGSPLKAMFKKHGHQVDLYDLYFYPNSTVFQKQYDFIVSTETFEHLYKPKDELETLLGMLQSGGYLLIMTLFFDDPKTFENSYYHRDPTHVVFFSKATFQYMAEAYQLELTFPHKNIALFKSTYYPEQYV